MTINHKRQAHSGTREQMPILNSALSEKRGNMFFFLEIFGIKKPPFWKNSRSKLKHWTSKIPFVWNLQRCIGILSKICCVCGKNATCCPTYFVNWRHHWQIQILWSNCSI